MAQKANLLGYRSGRLLVVGEDAPTSNGKARWSCRCDCGGETVSHAYSLTSGRAKSCGCLQRDVVKSLRTSHAGAAGRSRSKEYAAWLQVRRRCRDPRAPAYANYGGAGIVIAPEWENDFQAFLTHIGVAPSPRHSVDRIDNAKGYEPGNVRWATSKEQNRNKRKRFTVRYGGREMILVEACEAAGVDYYTAYSRLRRGAPFNGRG